MRLYAPIGSPHYSATLPQPVVPEKTGSNPKPAWFSVQPGDIFVSSRREENPASAEQDQSQPPTFAGHGNLRVRKEDMALAQSLIRKKGSATDALMGMATLRPQNVTDDLSETRIMQALIQQGADVNHLSENGVSPLLAAVSSNNLQAASMLLRNGADINMKHHRRNAQRLNLAGVPSLLMTESKITYPVLETRSLKMLALLLNHGANVNAIGQNESTHRQFSAFEQLGGIANKKLKILMRAKPDDKPISIALHNIMAQVRKTYVRPWITGNQTGQLGALKRLIEAGAIPTHEELAKLDRLLEVAIRANQVSEQYLPDTQRRLVKSEKLLLDIQDILARKREEATLNLARITEDIISRCAHQKQSPEGYVQALKDCERIKKELQKGADPTYAITQLVILRDNNKNAFQDLLDVLPEIKAETPTPPQVTSTFRVPALKRSPAMGFSVDVNSEHPLKKMKS